MPFKDSEQRRAFQRVWLARRRAEWFAANGPCVDCGSNDNLQLDHVDARSKVSHRVFSWSAKRRETELAKCVVRCRPCHCVKTVAGQENARGEQIAQSKLTDEIVRAIRASTAGHRELARRYSVDEKAIRQVRLGTTWKHVT